MPARHAGFVAVTVVSEKLVNQVLETYVNTFGPVSQPQLTVSLADANPRQLGPVRCESGGFAPREHPRQDRTVFVARRSKIHKVPGKGGCRFSSQYLLPSMHSPFVFISPRRFTGLPFDLRDIEAHRDQVCPCCFFGGPDKHPSMSIMNKVDQTGVIGKLVRP